MGEGHTRSRETRDARYDSLFVGTVTDNQDPLGLGRVRVRVVGLLEPESRFAFPIGGMFGPKNGIFWVPEVDSQVAVWLNQGDVNHPFYMAGPWGSPGGTSDVPGQAPAGDPDVAVIRWRDFHITFDGNENAEKITIEDLGSGTKLEVDRTTGNYTRDVEGSEIVEVKTDRDVTVEEGDETHTVVAGKRTTTIQGDDERTIVAGDEKETITAGSKILTMPLGSETKTLAVGGSTETMPAGIKQVNALTINLVASGAVNVTAGGVATVQGVGVSVSSTGGGATSVTSTGTTLKQSTGLLTETLLGGFAATLIGAFARVITGAATWTVSGIVSFISAVILLGTGPHKRLATEDFVLSIYNIHTHGGVQAGASNSAVPNQLGTPTEMTSETKAS